MNEILELNTLAKPVKGEAHAAIAKHLHGLGVDELWIDLIVMNVSEVRATRKQAILHKLSAAQCVDQLMTWVDTPEGHTFWMGVCDAFGNGNLNPVHLLLKD